MEFTEPQKRLLDDMMYDFRFSGSVPFDAILDQLQAMQSTGLQSVKLGDHDGGNTYEEVDSFIDDFSDEIQDFINKEVPAPDYFGNLLEQSSRYNLANSYIVHELSSITPEQLKEYCVEYCKHNNRLDIEFNHEPENDSGMDF